MCHKFISQANACVFTKGSPSAPCFGKHLFDTYVVVLNPFYMFGEEDNFVLWSQHNGAL